LIIDIYSRESKRIKWQDKAFTPPLPSSLLELPPLFHTTTPPLNSTQP
jgi:hypothetical protein